MPENLSSGGFFHKVSYIIIKRWFITSNYYFSPQPTNVNAFVTGKLDFTKCFHCGITLQDWKETDCCQEKHAKLSPECIFIIVKGIQFVLDHAKTTGNM